MQPEDFPMMSSEMTSIEIAPPGDDVPAQGRQARLAAVLRLVLEHLDAGAVVAVTPAELRLAHRLQGALAAFDMSSRVWSDPLPSGDAG
jgi:hypothetical protein